MSGLSEAWEKNAGAVLALVCDRPRWFPCRQPMTTAVTLLHLSIPRACPNVVSARPRGSDPDPHLSSDSRRATLPPFDLFLHECFPTVHNPTRSSELFSHAVSLPRPKNSPAHGTMGLAFSRLWERMFGKKEMRILMVRLGLRF